MTGQTQELEGVMIKLESMAVEMPQVMGHPNRAGFRGVLTMVDVPSQRSPSGAKGHLVVLTKKAAEEALPSLLGMALDYSPSFDRHDVRRKVGVITGAEIVERSLEIEGYLFGRDFPDVVSEVEKKGASRKSRREGTADLQAASRRGGDWLNAHKFEWSLRSAAEQIQTLMMAMLRGSRHEHVQNFQGRIRAESGALAIADSSLGLSYEVTDVMLSDTRSQIWILEKVTFTGAAILRRDKAAYRHTWIELCPQ
jgi:hypothetical protein